MRRTSNSFYVTYESLTLYFDRPVAEYMMPLKYILKVISQLTHHPQNKPMVQRASCTTCCTEQKTVFGVLLMCYVNSGKIQNATNFGFASYMWWHLQTYQTHGPVLQVLMATTQLLDEGWCCGPSPSHNKHSLPQHEINRAAFMGRSRGKPHFW